MGFLYIEIKPVSIEFDHFSYEDRNSDTLKYTRFISFEGGTEYELIEGDDLYISEDGVRLDLPDIASVIIRDNRNDENLRECKYFSEYIDNEVNVRNKSKFDIAIDYNEKEFDVVWNLIQKMELGKIKIIAGVDLPDTNEDDFTRILNIDKEKKEWSVKSFSLMLEKR